MSAPDLKLPELPCACASLRRAARAVSQFYETELADTGLTITQFTLLQVLSRTSEIRQRELGELLVMDSTTLTRTLRLLTARKLIRKSVGEDRRERYWALTATGLNALEAALPLWKRTQSRLKQNLGRETYEQLRLVSQAAAEVGVGRA